MKTYDAIVLGLGAMGSATLYQLAQRGARVLGIDQYSPPHKLGSTHGDTRITRLAIGEGQAYVPLALRSHEIWRALERETGEKLLHPCGGLIIAAEARGSTAHHGVVNFLEETVAAAKRYAIEHEELNCSELRARFPQIRFSGDEKAYFEPEAGYLLPERCIEVQLRRAADFGAEIVTNTKVLKVANDSKGSIIEVYAAGSEFRAKHIIICAGPWVKDFLPDELRRHLKIYRQILFWFEIAADWQEFEPARLPIFIWTSSSDESFYGFPAIDGKDGGMKLARSEYDQECTPDNVQRTVSAAEIECAQRVFAKHLPIGDKCLRTATCLYSVTPDSGFLIDWHPAIRGALIASPCSGHGFKHSAAIGEALAELTLAGKCTLDLSAFSCRSW